MLLELLCFALLVALFLYNWNDPLARVESADSFYGRACADNPDLSTFVDPAHRLRECRTAEGTAVTVSEVPINGYLDEATRAVVVEPDKCPGVGGLVNFDGADHRLCLPYRKSILLPRFARYEISTVPCFYEQEGAKVEFRQLDLEPGLQSKKHIGDQMGAAYFVCDGRRGISHVEFCPQAYWFDADIANCIGDIPGLSLIKS